MNRGDKKGADVPNGHEHAGDAPEANRFARVPLLPLRSNVIFPRSVYPLTLEGEHAERVLVAARKHDVQVALFLERNPSDDSATDSLYNVGTLARVTEVSRSPDGTFDLSAEGLQRVRLSRLVEYEPYALAEVELLSDGEPGCSGSAPLSGRVTALYRGLISTDPAVAARIEPVLTDTADPAELAYLIASTLPLSLESRQAILEANDAEKRLTLLLPLLEDLTRKNNRHLRSVSPATPAPGSAQDIHEAAELASSLAAAQLPPSAHAVARRELDRLGALNPTAADYNLIRTYLQWLFDLPWHPEPEPEVDLERAREILDRDHFGQEEVKQRIIEYLAVGKLRQERGAPVDDTPTVLNTRPATQPVLCLVGPPGVGKTSLGRSIAEALNRPFARISLGGMSDEAELRGHRRTYLGAMPGRIIQAVARSGSSRPLIVLDELDKLGAHSKGDPQAALLDVLDPEQQRGFVDHYIDVPYDISTVIFVATANTLESLPAPLRDRLEVIRLSGYTEEEKVQIALRHVIPRQMDWHALTGSDLIWSPEGVYEIIRRYTREAGVRQLEREIAAVCRRVAAMVAHDTHIQVPACMADAQLISDVLGTPRFLPDEPEATEQPGVVPGVFWTAVGGDVMHVEAIMMEGAKTLTITGQLGEIMRESAQAALSYVRANARSLGIDPAFYESHDVHLHIPSGATSKDGPSAGITLATALISLLLKQPVPANLGMSGELTLRGRVLPVGGIKEKVLAARRAGLRRVILPSQNSRDIGDLPRELLDDMQIIFVSTMEEVITIAFGREHIRQGSDRSWANSNGLRYREDDNHGSPAAARDRR